MWGHASQGGVFGVPQFAGLVVPGSGFGADPRQGLFRLVYLADEQVLSEVFYRISRFLRSRD